MIEHDPGHAYTLDVYPAKEEEKQVIPLQLFVTFRKRLGEAYPGNTGRPMDGTTTQELLRAVIARTKYVNRQATILKDDPSNKYNETVILDARHSLYALENRAAYRRGPEYYNQWMGDFAELSMVGETIENMPVCTTCGHILCRRHM